MNKKVLAIFDSEDRYAHGLMEYMTSRDNIPFRVHVFTDSDRFYAYCKKDEIECLLVSENVYSDEVEKLNIPHIIILSESGRLLNNTEHHIGKYQSCENIYKEVLQYYSEEINDIHSMVRNNSRRMKIIGVYTPIGRCLQTSFAICLGQILSTSSKTLYMNFERYSGLGNLLSREFNKDLSDLMYYFECTKERLSVRLDSIVESVNGLDFIPPVNIFQNLSGIQKDQWLGLFCEMEKCTEYEYLILDLTDSISDVWEILRICDVVYTITKNDPIATAKVVQYEKILYDLNYEDVINKTKKCNLPIFRNYNQRFDDLTIGELASFIRLNILPDIKRLY